MKSESLKFIAEGVKANADNVRNIGGTYMTAAVEAGSLLAEEMNSYTDSLDIASVAVILALLGEDLADSVSQVKDDADHHGDGALGAMLYANTLGASYMITADMLFDKLGVND